MSCDIGCSLPLANIHFVQAGSLNPKHTKIYAASSKAKQNMHLVFNIKCCKRGYAVGGWEVKALHFQWAERELIRVSRGIKWLEQKGTGVRRFWVYVRALTEQHLAAKLWSVLSGIKSNLVNHKIEPNETGWEKKMELRVISAGMLSVSIVLKTKGALESWMLF